MNCLLIFYKQLLVIRNICKNLFTYMIEGRDGHDFDFKIKIMI